MRLSGITSDSVRRFRGTTRAFAVGRKEFLVIFFIDFSLFAFRDGMNGADQIVICRFEGYEQQAATCGEPNNNIAPLILGVPLVEQFYAIGIVRPPATSSKLTP